MKKQITVIGLILCIICCAALTAAGAAEKRINNYVLIKYLLKRANIDFDVITFERADGIYKGMVISGPDRAPVIVAINQTAPEKNATLFSVDGEDTIATVSENGTLVFKGQQAGDEARGFLCIFQSILNVSKALELCEKDNTRCVLQSLILFADNVLTCVGL